MQLQVDFNLGEQYLYCRLAEPYASIVTMVQYRADKGQTVLLRRIQLCEIVCV
jgi:hypothetical protein